MAKVYFQDKLTKVIRSVEDSLPKNALLIAKMKNAKISQLDEDGKTWLSKEKWEILKKCDYKKMTKNNSEIYKANIHLLGEIPRDSIKEDVKKEQKESKKEQAETNPSTE